MAWTGSTGAISAGSGETETSLKTFLDANPSYGIMEWGGAVIRNASLVIPTGNDATFNFGENLIFDDAGAFGLTVNTGATVNFKNGGGIVLNGATGFNKLVGKINGNNITYRVNCNTANGRTDFFGTNTTSDGMKNLTCVVGKGASGQQVYLHFQSMAGKIEGLRMINDVTSSIGFWVIEFGSGAYSGVTFPSTLSNNGITVNLSVALARNGGTSTLTTPSFPSNSYTFGNTGIAGQAFLIDELWPDRADGTPGTFAGSASTDVFRQYNWRPGTYQTAGGWNVRLRDSRATPVVYQNGVVTSAAAIPLTWQFFKNNAATNYGPFKLLARKPGFIGRYETFTPIAPRSEAFLPEVDPTYTSDQSALAGIAANAGTLTLTTSASMTYDQMYDWFQWWMSQSAQMAAFPDAARIDTVNGTQWSLPTGWTWNHTGGTISSGQKVTFFSAPTVSLTGGQIEAIYGSSAGVSTVLDLREVSDGSAYIIANNDTGATIQYGTNTTGSAQTYTAYFPPGSAGTQVLVAREKYGYQRSAEVLTLAAGGMWYTFVDIPDVGISNTSQSAVAAYTTIENADKFYDRTALFRLTEAGIKLGQIATRDGTSVRVAGYNMVINQSAASVYDISGATITLKATGYANGDKFTNTVLDNTKTLTANTNEVLSADFEDANGDSGLTILGGDGTFELWKVTTSTATADYQTGTKLTTPTIGNVRFRFIGVTGFDIVGVDINSNVRRRTSMAKGVYTQAFYVGDQIQLAQAPEVLEINNKVDLLAVDIEAVKGAGFATGKHSLVKLKQHVTNMNQA